MRRAASLLTFLILTVVGTASAVAQAERTCDGPQGSEFDFWLGEWNLKWPGGQAGTPEDETGRGTNVITKVLDDCVILENFRTEGFSGMSVSTIKRQTGKWHQTWVDSNGGFLTFRGEFRDGEMELRTEPFENPAGEQQVNRMVWRNIADDLLDWHWQRSLDKGGTWEDLWVIRYTRSDANDSE